MAKHGGFRTEVELARVVVAWLQVEGWDVYQEVDGADIVATREGHTAVVECKLALNLTVLGQAWRWRPRAHAIYAAVPRYAGDHTCATFARAACRVLGLGFLEVTPPDERRPALIPGRVTVCVPSALREPEDTRRPLAAMLRPEHKTFAEAGSPTGHRWTPFRETERALGEHVAAHPGVFARDALKAIKHHWRTADPTGQCVGLIDSGILKGVRAERDGRRVRLYPDTAIPGVQPSAPAPPPSPAIVPPPELDVDPTPRRRLRSWQRPSSGIAGPGT